MKKKDMFVHSPAAAYELKTYSIHEAKTNFSKLVKRAASGEIIYIGSYGKPEVMIKIANQNEINAKLRSEAFGCMKGKIVLHKDWDAPLPDDVINEFYNMRGLEEFEKK